MSQNVIEFTYGQRCMDGRDQGQSAAATVDGYRAVLPPSLEAPSTERKQLPSCNMGEENNSGPAIAWLPEKIGQSARHTDIDHPATKNGHTENEIKHNPRQDVSIIHKSLDASFTRSSG